VLLSTLPIFRTEICGISAFLKDFVKNSFFLLGRIFSKELVFLFRLGSLSFFEKT